MPFPDYPHQAEAKAKMAGREQFALFMGMRTGKSKVTIDDWQENSDPRRAPTLLVVAPAGSYRIWQDQELPRHLTDPERTIVATWDSAQSYRSIETVDPRNLRDRARPKVLVANVEAFSTSGDLKRFCAEFLEGSRQSYLAVDEATTIKSWDAKRAKALREIGESAGYRRILTGLPTPRSPLDIWGQFEFLKPGLLGFLSYKAFEQRYAVVRHMRVGGKYSIRVPVRYTEHVEEMWAQRIEPHSYRKRLRDCADVPDLQYVTREVPLTAQQERMYREMERQATTEITSDVHMTATMAVTRAMRMHQLCCGWATDEEGGRHAVPENRTQAVLDLVAETDGKMVVWCSYVPDLIKVAGAIEREYGPEYVARYHGQNRSTRHEDDARFKGNDACRVMVATPSSGGRGVDWSVADTLAYYSNTDNLEYRDQSEERASSMQQAGRKKTIVDFAARDTVEWKILFAMRKKMDLASVILGDPPREWIV